jgi:hypothetical protein
VAALILPVSSFYLRKYKKAGREKGEKSEYVWAGDTRQQPGRTLRVHPVKTHFFKNYLNFPALYGTV